MKKYSIFLGMALWASQVIGQVGIGTTTPAQASMLEVSSQTNGTGPYRGFMPPRVPDIAARDAINVNANDTGMLIFVQSSGCLQMWNGISWESVTCPSVAIVTVAMQDFDANTTWNYSVNPAFYNSSDDVWDIVNSLPNILNFSGYFLGCRDLDNPIVGSGVTHEISFSDVNVSAIVNPRIAFDYDIYEFDNGDWVEYEVFLEGVGQGKVRLISGNGNYSERGTKVINVPNGTTNVSLVLGIKQDGHDDRAGFDNFIVYGQ